MLLLFPCHLQGQIKQLLTGLMLNTPPLVRAQLSEALTLISGHDFPAAWPQLLPELVERLAGALWLQAKLPRGLSSKGQMQSVCSRLHTAKYSQHIYAVHCYICSR